MENSEIRTLAKKVDYDYMGEDINHFVVAGKLCYLQANIRTPNSGTVVKMAVQTPTMSSGAKGEYLGQEVDIFYFILVLL